MQINLITELSKLFVDLLCADDEVEKMEIVKKWNILIKPYDMRIGIVDERRLENGRYNSRGTRKTL